MEILLEEEKEEISDFGPSPCCPEGRMRYYGGSRYFCDWCGRDEIRPAADLVPITSVKNIITQEK